MEMRQWIELMRQAPKKYLAICTIAWKRFMHWHVDYCQHEVWQQKIRGLVVRGSVIAPKCMAKMMTYL
eukprot:3926310-Pyramimonas_sp.AAC.1